MTNEGLVDYERDILRNLNGVPVKGLVWGAAMSEAIESLHSGGYVRREMTAYGLEYKITGKGREAIN